MPSPGAPAVLSRRPWRLSAVPIVEGDPIAWEFWFDVPLGWTAARPEDVREAQDPNGGPPTLLTVGGSVQPRRLTVPIRITTRGAAQRQARMAQLESLVAGRGPYQLLAPLISSTPLTVLLLPPSGGLVWTPTGPAWTTSVVFQEVGTIPNSGAGVATLGWSMIEALPGVQYTVRVSWDYSGTDQTLGDFLVLYQSGVLGVDIAARSTDLLYPPRWFLVVGTNGVRAGSASVNIPAAWLEAFPAWLLGYYSVANGLVAVTLPVTTPTVSSTLVPGTATLTWDVRDAAPGSQYTVYVSWDYSGTDQTSSDAIIVHQDGVTSAEVAAHLDDPTGAGRWFTFGPTSGRRVGDLLVTIGAWRLEAYDDWLVSYYSVANGLVDTALAAPLPTPTIPPPDFSWTWTETDAADGYYYADVHWTYTFIGSPTPLDTIVLYQPGVSSDNIADNVDSPAFWFHVVGTGGNRSGRVVVPVRVDWISAHAVWQLGYWNTTGMLFDSTIDVTTPT